MPRGKMSEKYVKILEAFYAAKRVNHYYWVHTPHDSPDVSVENIHAIISLMSGVTIEKYLINAPSEYHRAYVERYDGGRLAKIFVIGGQDHKWQRFAAVKELCHVLIDKQSDFQPDPCVTIEKLKDGTRLMDDESAPEADSERLAEIIAVELIYPLEFRRKDQRAHAQGTSLEELADLRQVPTKYISLGIEERSIVECTALWGALSSIAVMPGNLNEQIMKSQYKNKVLNG